MKPTLILEVEYDDEINLLEAAAELIEKAREQGNPKCARIINVPSTIEIAP